MPKRLCYAYIDAMAVLRDATEPTCIVYMGMIYTHSVCAQPNTKAFESDKSVHWTRQFEYNVIYYYLELLWDSMLNSCIEFAVALSLSPSLSLPWTHFALCIFVASASMQMLLYWYSLLFFLYLILLFLCVLFFVCVCNSFGAFRLNVYVWAAAATAAAFSVFYIPLYIRKYSWMNNK